MSYNPNYGGGHGYGGQYTGGESGYGPPSSPPRGYGVPSSGSPESPPMGYGVPPSGSPPGGYGPPSGSAPGGYGPPSGSAPGGYVPPSGSAPGGYGPPSGPPPRGFRPPGPPPGGYGPQALYGSGRGGPGRFVSPGDYVMPPGADPQLWDWFTKADLDHSGFINDMGLEFALINIGDWTPFDLDTIRLLMTMSDNDRDGRINFNQFVALWRYIKDSQKTFRRFDRDGSRSIDNAQLGNALSQFGPGYHLQPHVIMLLQKKYAPNVANSPHGIPFDRFVRVCVVVKQLYDSFRSLDSDHDGLIHLTQDKFLETFLSLP